MVSPASTLAMYSSRLEPVIASHRMGTKSSDGETRRGTAAGLADEGDEEEREVGRRRVDPGAQRARGCSR